MNPPLAPAESGYVMPVVSPLRPIMRLGWRLEREGIYFGLSAALVGHAAAIFAPYFTLWMIHLTVVNMNRELTAYYKREFAVDVIADKEKEKEKPPEPAPEAVPEPEPPPPVPTAYKPPPDETQPPDEDPYPDEPPPQAAAAPDVLTVPNDGDMSGDGWDIVDSDDPNSIPGSGYSSNRGKSTKHVESKYASDKGDDNSKSKRPPRPRKPPPEPKESLARAARPRDTNWSCPFPPQADLHQIHRAVAVVSVTVGPDGRATSASVAVDPGYGFGANARRCAMSKTYQPALDKDGNKTTQTISVKVNFRR
jgi:protein TonB